jgi:hypothetical protein
MISLTVSNFIAVAISALFAASALLHLAGPRVVRDAYARWGFPAEFHRVAGVAELLTAIFLAESITRIWGVVLGGMVVSVVVVTLLKNRQYAWTILPLCVLVALAPASLSGIY